MSQEIFGKDVLPTLEVDAHGLLLDCGFVGLPGQLAFFQDRGNLSGFEPKMAAALDLAVGWRYADFRSGFDQPGWDYRQIANDAGVEFQEPKREGAVEVVEGGLFPGSDVLDDRTIVSFTINFEPNQSDFSADTLRGGIQSSHSVRLDLRQRRHGHPRPRRSDQGLDGYDQGGNGETDHQTNRTEG